MSSFNSGVLFNGIDLGFISSMVNRVKDDPEKAKRTIKANTVWLGGTRSESTIRDFKYIADEPWGNVQGGAQPGELVLAALGACLVVGYSFDGALHGIELKKIEIQVEGDSNGIAFMQIPTDILPNLTTARIKVYLESDASPDILEEMHKRVISISPVSSTLSNIAKLEFDLTTGSGV
ncbi:hypothetical protein DP73_21500 [Desulfosporosinus sp. HMP52]|uniref:OsmC family protein n=1 Tax=Desulfosporosinus sp. HMP52 TaxID=1487923 RepID=UPI00051FB2F0|nr:OsmC family protein [Desulfosporosinus sp. HMP52]KGK81252.1 hypothetical protein DP73_21500 [Desulfosporosinus sp. HMP52]